MMSPLEVWGGLECTVARIGDEYVDQTLLSGHQHRLSDLDDFAALGIRAIRYPVLWERVAPDGLDCADWRWTDERLGRLRELGLRPIAGLVHHGSGPRHTDLTRPSLATGLGDYAGRVAERYPWLEFYTPVNEPLTTARFSGLYGHWYPHACDHRLFLRMVVNQANATRLAMQAIRRVNPAARLVQTEDLGRVLSTPRLAYQAAYENHRRWLSLDLLTGRIDHYHPLWPDLADAVPACELEELLAEPCPPDIIGINHYLSGERFLDEHVDRYPGVTPGGNGRDRYVDVLALRAVQQGVAGVENLLEEVWERYRLPVAVTEIHNGSSRDEQLRWLKEAWDAARRLRARGADIRAVTAWGLLGNYDWDSLLTRRAGHYEPGVFDLGGIEADSAAKRPRPTALAHMVRALARAGDADHPVLDGPGWWRRDDRLAWGPAACCPSTLPPRTLAAFAAPERPRPLLIAGGGALARALANVCVVRGLPHVVTTRDELDIAEPALVASALARHRPWAVANAAGFARVERAEARPERCRRENVEGARTLAQACAAADVPLLAFSSHLVFDGGKDGPYLEEDAAAPLCVYGASKAEAERILLVEAPDVLIVRSGPFFGPWDDCNLVTRALRALARGQGFATASDVMVSPSYLPDLADAALDLLIDEEKGIWHLANTGEATWAELVREAACVLRLDPRLVLGVPAAELGWTARRPLRSVLRSGRGGPMPPLGAALACYAGAIRAREAPRVSVGSFLTRFRPPA